MYVNTAALTQMSEVIASAVVSYLLAILQMETSSGLNEWNVSCCGHFQNVSLSTWTSEASTPVASVGFQSERAG